MSLNDHQVSVRDSVRHALADAFDQSGGGLLVRWALCAEVIDESGARDLWTLGSPGQAKWESIGLLDYALNEVREMEA